MPSVWNQRDCRATVLPIMCLSLEKVAELLGNELPLEASSRKPELARLRERQQKFQQLGGVAGLITFGFAGGLDDEPSH